MPRQYLAATLIAVLLLLLLLLLLAGSANSEPGPHSMRVAGTTEEKRIILWLWSIGRYVLFLHAAFINGRRHATRTYTYDRTTGAFEVCDYASGAETGSACDSFFVCRRGQWLPFG